MYYSILWCKNVSAKIFSKIILVSWLVSFSYSNIEQFKIIQAEGCIWWYFTLKLKDDQTSVLLANNIPIGFYFCEKKFVERSDIHMLINYISSSALDYGISGCLGSVAVFSVSHVSEQRVGTKHAWSRPLGYGPQVSFYFSNTFNYKLHTNRR